MRILFFWVALMAIGPGIDALPIYSFGASRTCDTCHASPFATDKKTEWKNPELKSRKCNMSCQGCHVNPSGAGIRTAPGRYFAQASLPVYNKQARPYHDLKRDPSNFLDFLRSKKEVPAAQVAVTPKASENTVAVPVQNKEDADARSTEKFTTYYPGDWFSWGSPLNASSLAEQSEYALRGDRYGSINADPFMTLGADVRLAMYNTPGNPIAVFPMQFDVGTAVHPVEHVTISATGGLQGRTSGFADSAADKRNNPAKLQNAFLLVHELPYQAYVQAGAFLPEFGTRGEDHTSFTRKLTEMDPTQPQNVVYGLQAGAAPNYPYISAAAFGTRKSDGTPDGTGYSANLAWRDIAFGGGFSAMQKFRPNYGTTPYQVTGNLTVFSANAYYNLWGLFPSTRYTAPMIILAEYNIGKMPRTTSSDRIFSILAVEWNWFTFNGLIYRVGYQIQNQDIEVKNSTLNRINTGFDLTVIPGLRFTFDLRYYLDGGGGSSDEFIFFAHGYL
jgi:hypothetical protein